MHSSIYCVPISYMPQNKDSIEVGEHNGKGTKQSREHEKSHANVTKDGTWKKLPRSMQTHMQMDDKNLVSIGVKWGRLEANTDTEFVSN